MPDDDDKPSSEKEDAPSDSDLGEESKPVPASEKESDDGDDSPEDEKEPWNSLDDKELLEDETL